MSRRPRPELRRALRDSRAWIGAMVGLGALACGPSDPGNGPGGAPSTTEAIPSDDATLADWTVSGSELFPAFSPDTSLYRLDAGPEVVLTAVPTDPDATVSLVLRHIDGEELFRGGAEEQLTLAEEQRVDAEVVAADGVTTRTYTITVVPSDFPIAEYWADEPSPGYLFVANFSKPAQPDNIGRYLMILDEAGVPLWYYRTVNPAYDFRPAPGDRVTAITDPPGASGFRGMVWGPDRKVETLIDAGDLDMDVHEFATRPDGTMLLIGLDTHPEDLSGYGGSPTQSVLDHVVQELDEDGALLRSWSTEGHLPMSHLPPDVLSRAGDPWERTHLNSIEVDPYDGNWVVSMRLPNQVAKIDPDTGDVLWRLGGAGSDFAFVDDPRLDWDGFAAQHSARVTGENRIAVYDNAFQLDAFAATGDSRFVEYQLDLGAMTATVTDAWSLAGSGFTGAGGSVQRLDDGHVLIGVGDLAEAADGTAPDVVEVDGAGNPVLELTLEGDQWSYRAWKFRRDETGWVLP